MGLRCDFKRAVAHRDGRLHAGIVSQVMLIEDEACMEGGHKMCPFIYGEAQNQSLWAIMRKL